MPLSEEEQRLLGEMERALSAEDPKFASTLRGTSIQQAARRRAILAGLIFAVGVCVLMGGAISGYWQIGIVGFVIMLGSATMALGAMRGHGAAAADPRQISNHPSGFGVVDGGRKSRRPGRSSRGGGRSSGSFMSRVEERWRRRRDSGGF